MLRRRRKIESSVQLLAIIRQENTEDETRGSPPADTPKCVAKHSTSPVKKKKGVHLK